MRLTIRTKLFAGFGAVLLLLGIVGGIGWRNTSDFATAFDRLYTDRLLPTKQLSRVQRALYELRLGAQGASYAAADAATREKVKASDAAWLRAVDDNLGAYAGAHLSLEEQEGLKAWEQAYGAYLRARLQVIDLVDQGRPAEAAGLRFGETTQAMGRAHEVLGGLIDVQDRVAAEADREVSSRAAASTKLLLGATALGLGAGAAVARGISRGISAAAGEMGRAAAGLAAGDLEQVVDVRSKDELGRMATAFREMIAYQTRMAAAADAIAGGDLTQQVAPQSARDVLGTAFARMTANLRGLVGALQQGAQELAAASTEILAATAQQAAGPPSSRRPSPRRRPP